MIFFFFSNGISRHDFGLHLVQKIEFLFPQYPVKLANKVLKLLVY